MKITVHDLGPIKEANIDLKPLTIFVGPNNAGKTWLAYTLAGIFSPLGLANYLENQAQNEHPTTYPLLEDVIKRVLASGSVSLDLIGFADKYSEKYFNDVAQNVAQSIHETIGLHAASCENVTISIDLAETKQVILDTLLKLHTRSNIGSRPRKPLFDIRKKAESRRLNINLYTQPIFSENIENEVLSEGISPDIVREFITGSILAALHRSLYRQVHILPTERTTYIAFPFPGKKSGEASSLSDHDVSDGRALKVVHAVGAFLGMISTTIENEVSMLQERIKLSERNEKVKKYLELASLMEETILSGKVIFSQQEIEGVIDVPPLDLTYSRHVLFQPALHKEMDISVASSMVKELSSLVLYLRYLAEPRDLIVIDEPEMNLHPEAQARMIEFLVILINAGLNVLITTHSPYLIDHLTNLIKASATEDKERIRNLFYLKRTDAFISKEQVSIYLIDDGRATDVVDEEGVIELGTFGEVSDRISDIFFAL